MTMISLITDFGTQDEYAGLMKAAILGIDPAAVVVDVSHQVEPQDVVQAAFLLESSYQYFPQGSIHVIVVDPGVGTQRRLLYLEADRHRFLAPDNGVFSLLLTRATPECLRCLQNPSLWRPLVGPTFHGRDILAPVAGHLSRGRQPIEIGPEIDASTLATLENLHSKPSEDEGVAGRIIHIDRFGNLITNIHWSVLQKMEMIRPGRQVAVSVGDQVVMGISRTYADAPAGRPVALIGSRGYLEIAVNGGNAQAFFGVFKRDAVGVHPVP